MIFPLILPAIPLVMLIWDGFTYEPKQVAEVQTEQNTSQTDDKKERGASFGPMQQFSNPGRSIGWIGF